MDQQVSLLDDVQVASPCAVPWDAMPGDAHVRYCPQCAQHVYNLSEMSRGDAEALLRQRAGRLCVRFYRRADGTVMTEDCPAGRRKRRRAVGLTGAVVVLVLVAVGWLGGLLASEDGRPSWLRGVEPFKTILGWLDGDSRREVIMGGLCPPPAVPGPPPANGPLPNN